MVNGGDGGDDNARVNKFANELNQQNRDGRVYSPFNIT